MAPGTHPLCHRPHGLDAGAIEIVIELPSLYELVVLDVFLHLLPGHHKVVVLAVHLVVTPRPGGVWREWEPRVSPE